MSTEPEPAHETPPHGFRTFLIVWLTQSVSVFGSALTFFAITIWLTQVLYPAPEQKAELASALAAIGLAFALPTLIISPFAGAWADRHDRKRTMISADLANGLISLTILMLMVNGLLGIWSLLGLMILFAITGAFHGAAFDTSYAMLVPEAQLPRANGMMQTIWALSGVLSPAIAAGIIALPGLARQDLLPGPFSGWLATLRDGAPLAIGIDTATFFLSSFVLLFLSIPSPKRSDVSESGEPRTSMLGDIREGAAFIWRRRPLLWLLGTFTVANFASPAVEVLMPLLVKFNLAADWQAQGFTFESALALLTSVGSIGGVAGGLLISVWGGLKRRRIYGVLVSMIIAGIAEIIFGLSPLLFLTAGISALLLGMTPIMNAHSQAIWQSQTPRELQGRVFSVRRVIAQCSWPLSTAISGWAGGLFDPGLVLATLGAILVVFCIAQLFNPYLRRIEDKGWLESLAARTTGPDPLPAE